MRLYNPTEGDVKQIIKVDGEPVEVAIEAMSYSGELSNALVDKMLKVYPFLKPREETVFTKERENKKIDNSAIGKRRTEIVKLNKQDISKEYEELREEFELMEKRMSQFEDKNYLDAVIEQSKILMAIHKELAAINYKTSLAWYERLFWLFFNLFRPIYIFNTPTMWGRRIRGWGFWIRNKLASLSQVFTMLDQSDKSNE